MSLYEGVSSFLAGRNKDGKWLCRVSGLVFPLSVLLPFTSNYLGHTYIFKPMRVSGIWTFIYVHFALQINVYAASKRQDSGTHRCGSFSPQFFATRKLYRIGTSGGKSAKLHHFQFLHQQENLDIVLTNSVFEWRKRMALNKIRTNCLVSHSSRYAYLFRLLIDPDWSRFNVSDRPYDC